MRCLYASSFLFTTASALTGPMHSSLSTSTTTDTARWSAMHMMDTDAPASSSSSEDVTRREAVSKAFQGSFLAAAAATGILPTPALAADIVKQMKQLEQQFGDTVNSNGAPEKHLPQVTMRRSVIPGQSADLVLVDVVVPHVMDAEKPHWIQAMWLHEEGTTTSGGGNVAVAKVFPATEPSPPTLSCGVPKGSTLTPYLYCNLHGLWKGEAFTA